MPDREPVYDHILISRPEGKMLRFLEQQARRIRHEQRVGQSLVVAPVTAAAVINNNQRARAHRTTAQSGLSSGSTTLLVFNVEDYDFGGGYDTSTGRYTAGTGAGGVYAVSGNVQITGIVVAGTIIYLTIFLNGTEYARGNRIETHSAGIYGVSVTDLILVSPNDIVDIRVFHNDGGNRSTEGSLSTGHFSIHRLS